MIQGVLDGVTDLGICSSDSDVMYRMVQANMGIGILPQKAYELFGRALGLHAVPLTDDWSDRALILVVRDEATLAAVSRMLFEQLRGVV